MSNFYWHLHLICWLFSGPIPSELGSLSKLQMMIISDNCLSGTFLNACASGFVICDLWLVLLLLYILPGSIPSALGDLSELTILSVNGNKLTGILP